MDVPIPVVVEMAFGTTAGTPAESLPWVDVTAALSTPVTMTRGRQDEMAEVAPSSAGLALRNVSGDFTPHNPLSPHYPHVRQGTPVRARLTGMGMAGVRTRSVPGVFNSWATTPDHAALDITGDTDIRLDVTLDRWSRDDNCDQVLVAKSQPGADYSWMLFLTATGNLYVTWMNAVTAAFGVTSPQAVAGFTRRVIRVTVDVDNGAAGRTIGFFHGPTVEGPWISLGAVTQAGTTNIHAGTGPLSVGGTHDGGFYFADTVAPDGVFHRLQVRSGIDGVVACDADFSAQQPGVTTLTESTGKQWALNGTAALVDPAVRFCGYVADLAVTWPHGDSQHAPPESVVEVTAAGPFRRLGQGQSPIRCALFRGLTSDAVTRPVAYWPVEDSPGSRQIASAFDAPPMVFDGVEDIEFTAYSDAPGAGDIAKFKQGWAYGQVPDYPDSIYARVMCFAAFPDTISAEASILEIDTGGSVGYWSVRVTPAGDLRVQCRRWSDFTVILDSTIGFGVLGKRGLAWLYLVQSGGDIDYQIGFMSDTDTVALVGGGTLAGHTFEAVRSVQVGSGGPDLGGTALGHVVVLSTDEFWVIADFARAWAGETAAQRMMRLSLEEGEPFRLFDQSATEKVGPQYPGTYLELMREAAAADGGILAEARDCLALEYRPRASLFNQAPRLVLDAGPPIGDIVNPFTVVVDDQGLRNYVTVTKRGGSSATVVDAASVELFGRYDESLTRNVASDDQLADHAGWAVRLGTITDPRYPSLTPALMARLDRLPARWTPVELGDRVMVTRLPAQHPPDVVELLIQGVAESLSPRGWEATANTTPGEPWLIGTAALTTDTDGDRQRADTTSSTLADPLTATTTTFFAHTREGPLWIDYVGYPAEFPFLVRFGGEIARVNTISPGLYDGYTRTVSNGWGTATTGQAWATSGGAVADYSTNGTQGRILLSSKNVVRTVVAGVSMTDTDCKVRIRVPAVATGAALTAGLLARSTNTTTQYRARVDFLTAGTVAVGLYAGTTLIGSTTATGLTYAATNEFWLRFEAVGSTLRARVWRNGANEPGIWHVEEIHAGFATGQLGCFALALTGNTNASPAFLFDDFELLNPQWFAVDRSINGVVKPHTAGTPFRLAFPATVGW